MIKVGITGGIGSGKSTICKIFSILGIPVYDADSQAKLLMNTNQAIKKQLIGEFGTETYTNDRLNKTYLAQQVFNDGNKVQKLNAIVHPQVALDFINWTESKKSAPYLLKEAALLVESGSYQDLDYLINVSSTHELRIKRIMHRDPFRNEKEISSIIAKQLTDTEREKYAQFTIKNDEKKLLIPQVLSIHHQLIQQVI